MLGPDVAMIERLRFLPRQREYFFDPWRVGNIARHLGIGTGANLLLHLNANRFEIEPELLQHIDGHALSKLDQAKQQMLRPHVIVVKAVGFLAGQGQDLLRTGCEIIHGFFLSPSVLARASAFVFGSGTDLSFSRSRSDRRPSRSSVVSLRSKSFCRCAG